MACAEKLFIVCWPLSDCTAEEKSLLRIPNNFNHTAHVLQKKVDPVLAVDILICGCALSRVTMGVSGSH